jgi:Spy/CpxP family protein refolding chaperone
MNRFIFLTLTCCALGSASLAESLTNEVMQFVQPRLQTADATAPDESKLAAILARPDPGTFFLRYAFGLKQHAKKLLTEEQRTRLLAVLDEHTPAHSRWHDERNTLRCKWTAVLWLHAAAGDADAAALRQKLGDWMRLRMVWTRQEHLAQYRFARAVWDVLTPEQQAKLIAGEWKPFAKQDTGHTRGDATAKIITRALGKPDDQAAFDAAIAAWSAQRLPLHAKVEKTEHAERRIVFAMDLNSESMAHAANEKATTAYAALYNAEADAIRRIVQAAYRDPAARCAKAAATAWAEAPKRFTPGASELIEFISSKLAGKGTPR